MIWLAGEVSFDNYFVIGQCKEIRKQFGGLLQRRLCQMKGTIVPAWRVENMLVYDLSSGGNFDIYIVIETSFRSIAEQDATVRIEKLQTVWTQQYRTFCVGSRIIKIS